MSEYRYYIKKTYKPVGDIVVLELADIRGVPIFDFRPGQYVMVRYRNRKGRMEEKHSFSIASSPLQKDSLRLGIRILGKFTTGLSRLEEGQEIFVSGPFGNFIFDEKKHSELILIAGGIGITPFISSLKYATDKKLSNKMRLLYSSRTLQGATFLDEILEIENNNQNIHAIFCITDEKLDFQSQQIINRKLDAEIIGNFVRQVYGKTFFLCGPVAFMEAMRRNLSAIGVRDSQIQTEEFSMIPDASLWLRTRNLFYALGFSTAIFILIFYSIYSSLRKKNNADISASAVPAPENTIQNTPNNQAGGAILSPSQPSKQTASPVAPKPLPRTRVS